MKRLLLVLALVATLMMASSAFAISTTEEKQQQYVTAQAELESYIQYPSAEGKNLVYVIANLKELGQYQFSEELMYYAQALMKLDAGELDSELDALMTLMQYTCVERINRYIEQNSGTMLVSVNALQEYVDGRKAEVAGDPALAIKHYQACGGFYDSRTRFAALLPLIPKDPNVQENAVELYSENGFTVTKIRMELVNRSILQCEDRHTMLLTIMESSVQYSAFIYGGESDTLSKRILSEYTPVFAVYFIQDATVSKQVEQTIMLQCDDELLTGSEVLASLPADGVIYFDLDNIMPKPSGWHAGTWTVQTMLDGGTILLTQLNVVN